MGSISLSDEKIVLVLVGSFDPDAARPEKLAESGVIRPTDLEALKYRALLSAQIADYTLSWCTISVTKERFLIESTQPPFIKISDLVLKTLTELMPNASVSMFGINRSYKMAFSDNETRDHFGVSLVPPREWGDWGKAISKQIEDGKVRRHGGMYQVTMREQPIEDREAGWRDVQIVAEPTPLGSTVVGGALLTLNDHFQLDEVKHPEAADASETARRRTTALLQMLADQFQSSIDETEAIAKGLLKRST